MTEPSAAAPGARPAASSPLAGTRIFSLVAGIAAIAAAVARFVLGGADIASPQLAPIMLIVWHGLTYTFALFGAALVASSRAGRDVAVAIAMLATAFFGGVVAIMAVSAGVALGDPLAYYPVYVIAGVTALCAIAAWRA